MSDRKKKKKLGWKGILLAIIVIIIAFILMGWHGFDFGGLGGNGDESSDTSNQSEDVDNNEEAEDEDTNPSGVSEEDGEDTVLSVVVDGNTLFYTMNYDDNEGLLETDMQALETRIEEETITQVDLYDRGAVKKTYDDIYQLLTDKGLSVVEKKE